MKSNYSFEDIHLSAFISSYGSTFLAQPHAKLPRLALANFSRIWILRTPLPVLQPSLKPSDGGLKPEAHLREPIFPFWGRCRRMCVGLGICEGLCHSSGCTRGPLAGKPEGKTKRVLFNCHLNKCLISSFIRKCISSPPYLISMRDGVASIAQRAFLFHTGMTSN